MADAALPIALGDGIDRSARRGGAGQVGGCFQPGASAQAKVRVGRCAVVLFSAIPVVLALRQLALVNFVVIYAGKLLVSFLFVPVVIGLNWRRATAPGAIAAMLGGLSVCVGWSLLSPNYPLGIDPWEIATATSLVLFVLVSRATTPVRRGKLDVFFPAGDGEPGDWWRVVACSAWAHLDEHGDPADTSGLRVPDAGRG